MERLFDLKGYEISENEKLVAWSFIISVIIVLGNV